MRKGWGINWRLSYLPQLKFVCCLHQPNFRPMSVKYNCVKVNSDISYSHYMFVIKTEALQI